MSIFDAFKKLESQNTSAPHGKIEYIIAGLGNPGLEYARTRHNTGFMAVDRFCELHDIKLNKMRFISDCGDVMIENKRCLVMKPATYMNNSGEAIEQARAYYKISCDNVIVIYDDISLKPGKLRIRRKGSAGGHNGIKSIIACMGTEEFPRIKIGTGNKPDARMDLADWVLGKYTDEQMALVNQAIEKSCEAVPLIVAGKIDEAMNKYSK